MDDHELDYASFEGVLPEGEYGAGKVEIWDKGTYKLIDKKEKKIVFEIIGEKLNGNYVLIKTQMGGNPKNWLFFKLKEK